MRVIGGKLSGRRIDPPANKWPTRPTTDYAREALFNILQHRLIWEEISMLDLFGGTGAISIEAASRGVAEVHYVERYFPCVRFVKSLIAQFNLPDQVNVWKQDVFKYIRTSTQKYDLIFADPPYDLPTMLDLPALIFKHELLKEDGLLIIEHAPQTDMSLLEHFQECRKYGSSVFSFFK